VITKPAFHNLQEISMIAMTHARTAHNSDSRSEPARSVALGTFLVIEALLPFAPLAILGPAIGWPQSLGNPAAAQLSAIAANADTVAFGYGVYLLYSFLIAPLMIALAWRLLGGLQRPLAATVAAFAALSVLARAIGILRWLTVMPVLAAAHASAEPAGRAQIEMLFNALNAYGGGVGEVLGVSLFMAASLGILSVAALARRSMPRVLAGLGLLASVLLAAIALPAFGLPGLVPVAVAVSVLSIWMLAVGVWMFIRRH